MVEIDRNLFLSLCRDKRHSNHYFVLNDQNYLTDFWADNDHEAQAIFREGSWK